MKQTARIFDSDDAIEAKAKLADAIASLAGPAAAEEHAPNLAVLLSLEEESEVADREQLFFSARVLVESLAMRGPTLLIYEDIHWADASLLDLLETFAARVRDVPVLFLALARPELLGLRPGWGGGLPAYTALPLEPLPDAAGRELATELLGPVDATTRAGQVAETAEGNPLFIEELARCLGERRATGLEELPTSIRAIIAARLDALPVSERAVLVDGSAVGRVFWRGALCEIDDRADLSQLLGSLEARDLIQREAVSRIKGDQQFAFKHGLIHDVAYGTLPRAARKAKHAAVARFLEATTDVGPVARGARPSLARRGRERARRRAPDRRRRPGRPRVGQSTSSDALPRGARAPRRGRRSPARRHAEARCRSPGRLPPPGRRRLRSASPASRSLR